MWGMGAALRLTKSEISYTDVEEATSLPVFNCVMGEPNSRPKHDFRHLKSSVIFAIMIGMISVLH
jgi:hypothetical protein